MPNTINGRDSASRAESKDLDSAIFAKQKSNQYVGAQAPTASRPCRGGENALKKCSSAFLAFLPRQGKSEALPPKDILCGCAKSGGFFGALRVRGGDNTPFSFAQTRDSKKLENIRENT
ncbi:hypothetical protein, partial [uncultured Helicobacter sp.]|uniref:hypothetical protein n=1 Tax=uncultured Helicobacter sp. TaxID=175537 RepID=UPI0037502B9A